MAGAVHSSLPRTGVGNLDPERTALRTIRTLVTGVTNGRVLVGHWKCHFKGEPT